MSASSLQLLSNSNPSPDDQDFLIALATAKVRPLWIIDVDDQVMEATPLSTGFDSVPWDAFEPPKGLSIQLCGHVYPTDIAHVFNSAS